MITTKIDNRFEIESARYALDFVGRHGAQAARVTVNKGIQSSFSTLNGDLENLQSTNDRSLYIQLVTNDRYGAYSTNRFEKNELEKFLKDALETNKYLSADECRKLPAKELCWDGVGEDLEQYDPYVAEMDPAKKKEIAFEVMEQAYGKSKKIVSVGSEYGDMLDYQYMADSQGFEGDSLQSNFTVSVECSLKGRTNARSEGWWWESSLHFKDFDYANCGKNALNRAMASLNPKKIQSGKFTMVVENTCSSRLVSPIFSALNGTNIQQKNSFLANKLGKKIFPKKLSLIDTPHIKGLSGSRYWDGDGLATKNRAIIDKGHISTFFINTYTANKMGMQSTVESPSVPKFNLEDFPAKYRNLDAKSIIKILDKGIFVTGFNGGNCNGATGDFSYGIQGFYFENGEILFPIKEMNISGNILKLWKNIALIGNDARTCSRWMIPSLAFTDVDFTGI